MAKAFLQEVSDHIFHNYKDTVEKLCIVLPNKRAALFLKQYLAKSFANSIWLPQIISAEELVADLSGLKTLEEVDLICHLYDSYRVSYGKDAEPFDSFVKWGQLILQDFNEIDRYLADPAQLYENLKDIKVIENWSLAQENLTEHQNNYLRFMGSLGTIYRHYTQFLLQNKWAYQGLVYRQAVENVAKSDFASKYEKILFGGFNALNAAELFIFKYFLDQKKAELLWDADKYYLSDNLQEAGFFLRRNFSYFAQKDNSFINDNFSGQKDIKIISVPKQMGQAQVVKAALQELIDKRIPMDRVAVVLANEKLLWPVLNQLPPSVNAVNITMEYPVKYSPTYAFIDQLIQIQSGFWRQNREHKTLYHKDVVSLLRQPLMRTYSRFKCPGLRVSVITDLIVSRNLTFITQKQLQELLGEHYVTLAPLIQPSNPEKYCRIISEVLENCITYFGGEKQNNHSRIELEYLYILLRNFNRLQELIHKYPQFTEMNAFRQLFSQVVGNSTAPFVGEPLKGLQIMGVLETRTLDFDHVIMVNVNEGILPSGKSINSFIPNDLKRAFGLPLYTEKDAIYAYHFYRMLQKTTEVTIIYDSETDTFGKGEKSRFVTQLQLELKRYNPSVSISETVATYKDFPDATANQISLQKDLEKLKPILKKAVSNEKYGALSPSALTSFKDCSLKFYFRYGVHLKETQEVEESAEANTFGSILHLGLEKLYKPLAGKIVTPDELQIQLQKVEDVVNETFLDFFEVVPAGKSILQKEVIVVYIKKLLRNDLRFIEELKLGNQYLSLHALEQEFTANIVLDLAEGPATIYIKGKIDRIDTCRGKYRVLDYKSSVKDSDKFVFTGFENLFHDRNYDKQLQLMIYAWLICKNGICSPEQLQPGIVPFKVFSEEPKYILGEDKRPLMFTERLLSDFERSLKKFIAGIFDMNLPFSQTADRKICEYCSYNVVCNFHP
jgi:ATP-dependent helicase/nuclease subunit B